MTSLFGIWCSVALTFCPVTSTTVKPCLSVALKRICGFDAESSGSRLFTSAAAAALVNSLEPLLSASNPQILFNATDKHGFTVVEVTGQNVKATLHQIPNSEVTHDYSATPGDLAGKFTTTAYSISGGTIAPA